MPSNTTSNMFFYQTLIESLFNMRKYTDNVSSTDNNLEEHEFAKRRSQAHRMPQIQDKLTLLLTKPIATPAFGFGC